MPNSKQNPLLNYRTLTDEDRFLNQQNKINAKYDSQINNLNLGKTTQQQQADITRSQLQKYLPYYYKSKGLSGLGLEQSAMLDANANYTNQLGQIENNFAQQKNALENYRQDDLMKAENDYLANIDKNSMSAYNEVTNPLEMYIADEKLTDDEYNKVNSILDLYRDQMNQTDIKMAENLLENYKTQFGKAGAETDNQSNVPNLKDDEFELTDKIKEGKDYLTVGDKKYKVKKKSDKYDVQSYFDVQNRLGKSQYASAYDSNIPNGTTIQYLRDTVWGERLRTAVYIDGEWYDVDEIKQ